MIYILFHLISNNLKNAELKTRKLQKQKKIKNNKNLESAIYCSKQ